MSYTSALPAILAASTLMLVASTARADDVIYQAPGTSAPGKPVAPPPVVAPVAPPIAVQAPDPGPPPEFRQTQEKEWYGWQTLIVDGGSLALAIGAIASESTSLGEVSLGTYALGGPIVHFAHGRVGIGFADLGVRVGAPVVLGLVGAVIGSSVGGNSNSDLSSSADGAAVGAVFGVFAGGAAAVAIDAAVFAREKPEYVVDRGSKDGASVRPTRDAGKIEWSPRVVRTKTGGVVAGIGGTF